MRSDNNDFYIGGRNLETQSQKSSSLAKHGKMNIQLSNSKAIPMKNIKYGDSISNFQEQLQRMSNKFQFRAQKKYLQRKKRAYTQNQYDSAEDQYSVKSNMAPTTSIKKDSSKQLQAQLDQIKKLIQQQSRVNNLESRFDRLYSQMEKKNSQKSQQMPFQSQMYPQQHYGYYPPPPYNMYPPPDYIQKRSQRSQQKPYYQDSDNSVHEHRSKKHSTGRSTFSVVDTKAKKSFVNPVILPKNRISLLKKHFFAVTFISFLKRQAKKLSLARRNNLRKFWVQKFDSQILNIKNFLLEALRYSLSIILQKRQLNFNFFNEKRQKVKVQKQKLVLQLTYLSVQQMKKLTNPKDVSLWSEILTVICRDGSFPISRFWTVNQMQKIRISQHYGFVRSDSNTQKFLMGVFVFMKVLIFNMLLQPYKFDSLNFKKTSEPLLSNMYLIASLLYHLVKEVLEQYLLWPKQSQMYEPGNWLSVRKQFICECCEPLKFNTDRPQQGQYISGMLQRQLFNELFQIDENQMKCAKIKQKIREVIEGLYKEMRAKSKMLKNNLKYKMYN